ncbi:MAG: LOG family protein [Chloroflexi bacterium]|nr:LOG family protein [Chloroflexota bacterium]
MIDRPNVVSVFGSSQVQPGSLAYVEGKQVGTLLAQAGLTVCSGGYGGVMEAVSRGAREAGGGAIGVTSSLFANRTANPWVSEEIPTSSFLERVQTMVSMAQGFLALKGGIGTLTEVSVVWSLLQTGSIPPKPLILLQDPWQGLLDFCAHKLVLRPTDWNHVRLASSAEAAAQILITSLRAGKR